MAALDRRESGFPNLRVDKFKNCKKGEVLSKKVRISRLLLGEFILIEATARRIKRSDKS